MIERRGDEIAVPVEPGRKARLDHPDVALVRKHDALRRPGRARGIEEHRGLARVRRNRLERAGIDKAIEAVGPAAAELDTGKIVRRIA